MKVQEAIDLINNSEEQFYSVNHAQERIGGKILVELQDPDEHRWYCIATMIVQLEDGIIGIRGVCSSYSEEQTYEDIGVHCEAFEVHPVESVYYERLS